ncbi:MAG: glycosyltransferase [Mariniblastus sp.]|nr:glycosyltransferase [Mariniblastus sp.]
MKISVITAVHNSIDTIQSAIDSVRNQNQSPIEHVVIDGMSDDGTGAILEQNKNDLANLIREPDQGIYDALNKGIRAATGDIIGFLHADDLLASPKALSWVADKFQSGNFDAVYADLAYVDAEDPNRIVRYWKAGNYQRSKFRRGWMPPHPTVYVKKTIYERLGMYRINIGSGADYECLIRLLVKHEIKVGYIPEILVKMRVGGTSNASFKNRMAANRADRQAWVENDLKPPLGLRFTKPLSKLPQYWRRPLS